MHRTLLAALLLALSPIAHADDRFTVASYNIENAFDVFDDPFTKDEGTDVKQRWEYEAIAKAIRELDADVVAFSELENEHVLRAMVQEFLPEMGYEHAASLPSNSDRGINLGVISRVPINRIASHRFREFAGPDGQTYRFARDLLQVTVQATPEHEVDVFVVHLKSKHDSANDPQSNKWRSSEARMASTLINAAMDRDPDKMALVVGDFNDEVGSATMNAFTQDAGLVDSHRELSGESRVTYLREPYRSTIDFVLATPELAKHYVPGSAKVLHDEALTRGSDHAPIAASFDLSN